MCPSSVIRQSILSDRLITAVDGPRDEGGSLLGIPFLGIGRGNGHRQQRQTPEKRANRRFRALCLIGLFTLSCESVTAPVVEVLSTSQLLILGLQPAAGGLSEQSFYVVNSRTVTHRLLHSDQFNTQFVEVRFPAGSIESVGGNPVGSQDSVLVTVQPLTGQYGLTVLPATLVFSAGNLPRATFTYAVYGDRSVADGSPTYATREAYSAALDLWEEVTVDRWQRATNSSTPGADEVSGALSGGGFHVVAAPR